jgi:hypothetical protein
MLYACSSTGVSGWSSRGCPDSACGWSDANDLVMWHLLLSTAHSSSVVPSSGGTTTTLAICGCFPVAGTFPWGARGGSRLRIRWWSWCWVRVRKRKISSLGRNRRRRYLQPSLPCWRRCGAIFLFLVCSGANPRFRLSRIITQVPALSPRWGHHIWRRTSFGGEVDGFTYYSEKKLLPLKFQIICTWDSMTECRLIDTQCILEMLHEVLVKLQDTRYFS